MYGLYLEYLWAKPYVKLGNEQNQNTGYNSR